jgi:hypothetical protein
MPRQKTKKKSTPKKDTPYKQCQVSLEDVKHIAWIPTKFAKVGKVLRIAGTDGYIVEEVYDITKTWEEVEKMGFYHLVHREATDI